MAPTRVPLWKRGSKGKVYIGEKADKKNECLGGIGIAHMKVAIQKEDAIAPDPEVGSKGTEHQGMAGHGHGQVRDRMLARKDDGRKSLQLL